MINEKTKSVAAVIFIIFINVFFSVFAKQFINLDGDFNAYVWGAKLSGIAEAMKYGELRLWNPNIWCGISGIHNFTDSFYPVAIVICKIFWSAEKEILSFNAYSAFILIHSTIATLGTYFLFKELELDNIVCVLVVLIGTPWVIVNTTYLQICWIPMFGYLFLKAYKKENLINNFLIMAGFVFGLFLLQELSQGAVLGVVMMILFYFVAVFNIICKEKNVKSIKKMTILFAIAGVIGICLSAVSLFPILEQQKEMLRVTAEGFANANEGVSLTNFYEYPISLESLRTILGANINGGWLGLIAVLFCVMGMFAKEEYLKNPYRYIILQFGKVFYVFIILASISCYLPEIFFYIPFVNRLRETYLYVGLLPIAVILLVGGGIEALYKCISKRKCPRDVFYNIPLMGVACVLIMTNYAIINYKNRLIIILLCLSAGIILMIRFKKNSLIIKMILLFIGILNVVYIYRFYNISNKYTRKEAQNQYEKILSGYKCLQDYMDSIADGESIYRIMIWGGEKGTISANSMVEAGGDFTQGYWEPIYRKTLERHWNLDLEKSITLDNVMFFIISGNESEEYMAYLSPFLDEHFEFMGVVNNIYPNYDAMEGQPICVYKNKDYVGDAWLVYDYIECSSEMPLEEQFAIINEPQFSVKDTVLVETDTETEALLQKVSQKDKNAIVQLIKYTNNSIELHICTANAGILVMAESDVKGWKVYVDEEEQKILSVNYANRGVLVDAGEHDIRMIYSPNSYRIGKIITVVTVLICVMAIIIISCKSKMRKNGNLI